MDNLKVLLRKDKVNKANEHPVIIQYVYKAEPKKFPTGVTLKKGQFKKSSPYVHEDCPDFKAKSEKILTKRNRISDIIKEYEKIHHTLPSVDYIEAQLSIPQERKLISFWDYYNAWVNDLKEQREHVKEMNSLKANLEGFLNHPLKEYKKYQLDFGFHKIDLEFLKKFIEFLQKHWKIRNKYRVNDQGEKEPLFGLNNNSLAYRLRVFRRFLKDTVIKHKIKFDFESFDESLTTAKRLYKISESRSRKFTVKFDHLKELIKFDPKSESLAKCRDRFIISCMLALRNGDMKRISKQNVAGQNFSITMGKTRKKVEFKMNETAIELLEKHDYHLDYFADQVYNRQLKKLFEKFYLWYKENKQPDLELQVWKPRMIGGEDKGSYEYIWDMLSSHRGRTSYVTMMLAAKTSPEKIMNTTGFTFKTISHYINEHSAKEDNYNDALNLK